jgi:hypothetical protein
VSTSKSKVPLELIFSDVWGPTCASIGRNNYYVSFIDDFNKFTLIYLIKHKSFHKFQEFQCMVERLFDRKSDKKQRGAERGCCTLFLMEKEVGKENGEGGLGGALSLLRHVEREGPDTTLGGGSWPAGP